MDSLEAEFGYRESEHKRKPNLLKQAEDIFGVQLSIQYKKALAGLATEEGVSLVVVEERKNSRAHAKGHFLPTSPIMKIPLTSEVAHTSPTLSAKDRLANQSGAVNGDQERRWAAQPSSDQRKEDFEEELV